MILYKPRVRALVGQGEAASVPELVRVGRQFQPGQVAVFSDHKPGGAPVQGVSRLAYKKRAAGRLHPRTLDHQRPEKAKLLGVKRICRRESFFKSRQVHVPAFDIDPGKLQRAGLRDPQAVAKHQKEQAAIAGGVSPAPCRIEELFDLPGGEVFSISIFQKRFLFGVLSSYYSPQTLTPSYERFRNMDN